MNCKVKKQIGKTYQITILGGEKQWALSQLDENSLVF